jgi:Flp pilus assembly protein TadG
MTIRSALARLGSTFRRFAADREGVGAIEFAILFPVLVMLYIGAFEITIGLSISKRVSRAAGTVADMVTQQESVTKSILSQMPRVAEGVFAPYGTANLDMKITAIQIDADAKPTVLWSWAGDTTGDTLPAPYAKGSAVSDVPESIRTADSFLIRAEVGIPYTMFLFAPDFLPESTRTITISRSYFYRQRQDDPVTCSDC